MLKNRSLQVKLVQDSEPSGESKESLAIDPNQIIENIVFGVGTIIVVYKVVSLFSSITEHLIVTKIR